MFADIFGTLRYVKHDSSFKKDNYRSFRCLYSFRENRKNLEGTFSAYTGMLLGTLTGTVASVLTGSSFLLYPVELFYNSVYDKTESKKVKDMSLNSLV